MPQSVALAAFAILIIWLFTRQGERPGRMSAALWIPLTWVFVIGSRPISLWLGTGSTENSDGSYDDRFIDKTVFLFLIVAGSFVLAKRRVNWSSVLRHNKWLFVYFAYLGLSVFWSNDSFTSFKRWIKDCGNVIMVLIVLTDEDPLLSVKTLLARCSYLMIPLSVLVIKYYPDISRRYDIWSNQPGFVGISTGKNLLGMSLFVCGLSLLWMLLGLRDGKSRFTEKIAATKYTIVLLMTGWLLYKAKCSTAISCGLLGALVLLALRVPMFQRQVKWLGIYITGCAVGIVLVQASGLWDDVVRGFAEAVGRDATLHGRAEIWAAVLKEDFNPLIGTGFYSFWSEERNRRLSESYYYQLGEAHNGYIETYINSGAIGLALLAMIIVSAGKRIRDEVLTMPDCGALRMAFLVAIGVYALSESIFDRLVHVWFAFLLVVLEPPRLQDQVSRVRRTHLLGGNVSAFSGRDSVLASARVWSLGRGDSDRQSRKHGHVGYA